MNLEFAQAAHVITIATFDAYGEHKMSSLYKNQPNEFSRRYMEGSENLLGVSSEFGSEQEVD